MMFSGSHHDVRTTLTLDPDVATRLRAEMRRSGKPFKVVVNDALRLAFTRRPSSHPTAAPFEIRARDLGALRPGLNLDDVGGLLEAAEGPSHR